MKALLLVALFAAGVSGTLIYKHATKPSQVTTKTAATEKVVIQTKTVSGNITEDLQSETTDFKNTTKNILKFNVPANRVVYVNTEVDALSMDSAIAQLKALEAESNDPIWLLLDSPGGSVLDGAALISQMEASKAPVNTVCTRLCASMAAMIHSYGKQRYALDRAILMYHPASGGVAGQMPNMLSLIKTINRYTSKMNANIVGRSSISKDEFEKLVAYELWIDAEDALAKGLVDGIVNLNVSSVDPKHPTVAPPPSDDEEEFKKKNPPGKRKHITIDMSSPFIIH